ncbi:hypothetical protein AB4Y81_10710 [Paenarthrobacter sp. TAF1]|uniref:hypothetical protein n=1 Tax=Paenarthrobacter sp. TAF1 TaxID=3233067 RepID=UPI003F98702D
MCISDRMCTAAAKVMAGDVSMDAAQQLEGLSVLVVAHAEMRLNEWRWPEMWWYIQRAQRILK